jgi:hypothetical protein
MVDAEDSVVITRPGTLGTVTETLVSTEHPVGQPVAEDADINPESLEVVEIGKDDETVIAAGGNVIDASGDIVYTEPVLDENGKLVGFTTSDTPPVKSGDDVVA